MNHRPKLSTPLFRRALQASLILSLALLMNTGCQNMNGVNVGTGINLPGGIRVGANKKVGSGSEKAPRKKASKSEDKTLRLYVFDCGVLRMTDVTAFGLSNSDTDVRQLFVPCYLIEHPTKGRLLWDAGLPLSLVGKGSQPLNEVSTQEYRESLLEQMAGLKIRPRDVDFVAFSHMHFDHVGAANAFVDSTLLIQEVEYDAAFKNAAENTYFDSSLYDQLAQNTKILLSGDHDVFGDGKVKIISAPGHTPGHQVLWIDLDNTGPVVLSGDLYHFEASRKLRSTPTFNTNREETLESMDKVEALIQRTGATLWIEHNLSLAIRLNMAPAYYD